MVLKISEQFYSIQGEGKTMGVPALFVRLQACNILCKGDWICDTIEVWKTGNTIEVNEWLVGLNKHINSFRAGAHLIFTGGEPLLQQKAIALAIRAFKAVYGFKPYVEIETNGTIMPSEELIEVVDLFNCSFKLSNSGVKYERRIKIDVLKKLNSCNSIFKIVVYPIDDYNEAELIFNEVGIDKKDIWLMPPADCFSDLSRRSQQVAAICKEKAVNFSSRLQLVLWNKTTGV